MDGLEPVQERQLAVVHDRVCRQRGLVTAFQTAPALVVAVPIMLAATALLADNARLLALLFQISLARCLVGETL
jgi:hypothetical protein